MADSTPVSTPAPSGSANGAARAPRVGSTREFKVRSRDGRSLDIRATADWLLLRKNEKPLADMFYVHYSVAGDSSPRPLTFVFNGGPGAASAYLHVGALGPKRVCFAADGTVLPPPAELIDNDTTWLSFTDLVFVDPIGTGFSRTFDDEPAKGADGKGADAAAKGDRSKSGATENPEFFRVGRDLEALGEFIQRFLSKNGLWSRPVYLAGESYGGFRVGKLTRLLQERYGVAITGAILISPALEIDQLFKATDYDAISWIDLLPSYAASAVHHGRSRAFAKGAEPSSFLPEVEAFAVSDYARWLVAGDALDASERARILAKLSAYMGLSESFVEARGGRVSFRDFSRELLRDQRKIAGLYDASSTAIDPFPDRSPADAPDPTLVGIGPTFAAGANRHLREVLGVTTDLDYHLLSFDVFLAWKLDSDVYSGQTPLGATDDLRYGMALNPHMRVWVVHGHYDLVTPYFSSRRLAGLMKLLPEGRERLRVESFKGGHMFYAWDESRERFFEAATGFFRG